MKFKKEEIVPEKTKTPEEIEQKIFDAWLEDVRQILKYHKKGTNTRLISSRMRFAESWVWEVIRKGEGWLIYERLKSGVIPMQCITDEQKKFMKLVDDTFASISLKRKNK